MAEVRAAVAHDDCFRHAQLGQRLPLERIDVETGRVGHVKPHVDERAGEIFGRREALVEGRGPLDPCDELVRNRFAGFVMHEIAVDHFVGQQPPFQEL